MAVILRATKGAANANSYATATEADAHFDMTYGASEWTGLTAEDKARLLITATRSIEELPLKYAKYAASQALNFPVVVDGVETGYDHAKAACIAQAFYLFENTDGLKEAQSGAIQGVKSEGLSSISKSVTGFNMLRKWASGTLRVLAPYLNFDLIVNKGPTLGVGYTGTLGRLFPR